MKQYRSGHVLDVVSSRAFRDCRRCTAGRCIGAWQYRIHHPPCFATGLTVANVALHPAGSRCPRSLSLGDIMPGSHVRAVCCHTSALPGNSCLHHSRCYAISNSSQRTQRSSSVMRLIPRRFTSTTARSKCRILMSAKQSQVRFG